MKFLLVYQCQLCLSVFIVLSCVQLLVTPWAVTCQALLLMAFTRQEYWSGFPFPSPRDLPNPGTEPVSPMSPALRADSWACRAQPAEPSGKPFICFVVVVPYQLKKSQRIESDQHDYLMVERYKKDGSHHQPTMFEEFFYRSWWKDNWIHHREALMVGSDREDTCQLISCYWYP